MQRFQKELDAINTEIVSFNQHLVPEFHIPKFDLATAFDQRCIVGILNKKWNDFQWPNNRTSGVYFLFGHERIQTEKNGIYIGKASWNSKTSERLYDHLIPYRGKDHFTKDGYNGEVYILDFIASVDTDKLNMPFMASALEEYLITNLKNQMNLINGTGNN